VIQLKKKASQYEKTKVLLQKYLDTGEITKESLID
jgi:phosphatidylinositol N-acetylglucosaminyltransferase subunit Q